MLKYRFPEAEVVAQCGTLKQVGISDVEEGFIFTNFEGTECFLFESEGELTAEQQLYFRKDKPYVFSQRSYMLQADSFLHGIHQMRLGKAVFSRIKSASFDGKLAFELFDALCEMYPKALVYLVSGEATGTWIGASPETLLEAHQGYLFTMSLAGTRKTSDVNGEWGQKEIIEQDLVTDFIVDQLKGMEAESIDMIGPYDFAAGPVTHLRTDISAYLPGGNPLDAARKLHPTPAVSGLPREQALTLISMTESHNRFLYTGMLGWISPAKTRLYVNLRCAQLQEENAFLYLGGGYTAQSIPELEWEETENKSRTLLNVMEKIRTR